QSARGCVEDVVVVHKRMVVAATKGARARGVSEGDSGQRAERLAPGAHILLREHGTELGVWEEVLHAIYATTPHMAEESSGTVLLHVRDMAMLRRLAEQFKACVGIAASRTTAQAASYFCEAGSILFVDDDEAKSFLRDASVECLTWWGAEEEWVEKMMLFGLRTLGAAAQITQRQMTAQFGKGGGIVHRCIRELLKDERHPLPLFEPPPVLRAEHRFDDPVREPRDLESVLRILMKELMGTLREVDGRRCSWIAVRMHGRSGIVRTERRILKDGTQSDGVLRTSAEILLRTLMDGSECTELQVEMGGLSIAAPEQMSFVPERVSPYSIARTVEQRYPRTMHRVQMKDPDAYLREQQWMLVPYSPLPVTVSS
ncbi:MAG: hypothetical protein ACKOBV_09490, partial [Candidatus Kapaibacterium sp.]